MILRLVLAKQQQSTVRSAFLCPWQHSDLAVCLCRTFILSAAGHGAQLLVTVMVGCALEEEQQKSNVHLDTENTKDRKHHNACMNIGTNIGTKPALTLHPALCKQLKLLALRACRKWSIVLQAACRGCSGVAAGSLASWLLDGRTGPCAAIWRMCAASPLQRRPQAMEAGLHTPVERFPRSPGGATKGKTATIIRAIITCDSVSYVQRYSRWQMLVQHRRHWAPPTPSQSQPTDSSSGPYPVWRDLGFSCQADQMDGSSYLPSDTVLNCCVLLPLSD